MTAAATMVVFDVGWRTFALIIVLALFAVLWSLGKEDDDA